MLYIVVVAGFATIPILLDIVLAYRAQREVADSLMDKIVQRGAPDTLVANLRVLIEEFGTPPPGLPGLGRQTMALTVLLILGIALFHALVVGIPSASEPVIGNVLSVLAGAFSAIVGFYYGGKAAEKKTEPPK